MKKHVLIHIKYNRKTNGYEYEYKKEKADEIVTVNISVLANPDVVTFNTFDFERPVSLYYDDAGKPVYKYVSVSYTHLTLPTKA